MRDMAASLTEVDSEATETMGAFSVDEYRARLERARAGMATRNLDALIVTAPENICYLSGFTTTGYHTFQALIVPLDTEPFLILRDIEVDNAIRHSWIKDTVVLSSIDTPEQTVTKVLASRLRAGTVLGYDNTTTWLPPRVFSAVGALSNLKSFISDQGVVESLRAIKSDHELKYISRAAEIADLALMEGVRSLRDVGTDSDVAGAIQGKLAALGSGFTGSPPYIVAGAAAAGSHATHNLRPITSHDAIWLEIPASVERYHACVSRTIYQSHYRHPEIERAFDASKAALEAIIARARPGVLSGEVDAAGREAAWELGFTWRNRAAYAIGLSFPPGLGEGHIIDIKREDPRPLQAGMVFHVIPILKIPGVGAAGCTETIVIGEDHTYSLSSLPRELLSPSEVP